MHHVEHVITELRPIPPDRQGLWGTLEQHAQEFAMGSAIGCQWRMDIAPGLKAPHGPLAHAVCRIFQELLSNVERHARASRVEIRISATPSDISLVVKDNGCGAPPSAFDSADAFGVMGMRERVGQFGGWLHIDSQLGTGTTVILTLPLYQEPRLNQGAA